jgi:aminoglycoside phosphotransferase (APT) family kinase protein
VSSAPADLADALEAVVCRRLPGANGIAELRRLSGGANQETWSFDATIGGSTLPLILRRRPGGAGGGANTLNLSLEEEARVVALAGDSGVPVPGVRFVLEPADGVGSGYVMDRLEGETIARRILRDAAFAAVRPGLARQCGEILARIHEAPRERLTDLPVAPADVQLDLYRRSYDGFDHPHPVFELAFAWIAERLPETPEQGLVHGDFRNGNLLIGEGGVRGVLDWEIAHLGDPMEDLGWICVNSWRFGVIDKPVGGFGTREDLFAGYAAVSGREVDPERVRFWEVLGSLKWGIMCMMMVGIFHSGVDRSVERAAIGRRSSEAEIDLLALVGG